MNTHHKALARWNLAVKATEFALKRLLTIGGANCNNEAYVTTQLENADEYLCQALTHIRSFSDPATSPRRHTETTSHPWNPPLGIKEQLPEQQKAKEKLAKTFVPSVLPPRSPKPSSDTFEGAFPAHADSCGCSQCMGNVRYE